MDAVMATLKKNLMLARTMREQKKLESGGSIKVPGNATCNLSLVHQFHGNK